MSSPARSAAPGSVDTGASATVAQTSDSLTGTWTGKSAFTGTVTSAAGVCTATLTFADGTNDVGTLADGGCTVDWTDGTSWSRSPICYAGAAGPYVLWLDASRGVTEVDGGVSAWADQSGQGNDATALASVPMPTLDPAGLHGAPAMSFSGNSTTGFGGFGVDDATSLQWGTGDYAVVVVGWYTNANPDDSPATWGTLYNKNCLGSPFVGPAMWGIYPLGGASTSTARMTSRTENGEIAQVPVTTDDGQPHVLAMRRIGTTLTVWADGAASSQTIAAVDVSQDSCTTSIGGAVQGEIAEVIAIQGAVNNADMASLTADLRARYGF
jgi:hypothetical protein